MSISSLIDLEGQLLGRDFSATPQTQNNSKPPNRRKGWKMNGVATPI